MRAASQVAKQPQYYYCCKAAERAMGQAGVITGDNSEDKINNGTQQ